MTPEERQATAEKWQKAVALYATRLSTNLRMFGIEVTPEEAHDMATEELKLAVRQNLRDLFLKMMQS